MKRFCLLMCLGMLSLVSTVRANEPAQPAWSHLRTQVTVQVLVKVPADTPKEGPVFLAGAGEALGNWKVDGLPLKRDADGTWRGQFAARVGDVVEGKVNRGSWDTVEKGPNGDEVANRRFVVEKDQPWEIRVSRWAGQAPSGSSSLTGDIRRHSGFASKHLKNTRDLFVYLPPAYDQQKTKRYSVLYLHDGQNLFDRATGFMGREWNVDETAEKLIKGKRLAPVIIVGVANTPGRNDEYTPVYSAEHKFGGKGDLYARFLVEEVKPFIDRTYRTLPDRAHTAVGGSSLGGLISLYICSRYPQVFSGCAALSPSLWWEKAWILSDLSSRLDQLKNTRFWVDIGTREGDNPQAHLDNLRRLADLLRKAGLREGVDFTAREIEGATHSEQAWSARFDQVLQFLYRSQTR